MFMNLKFNIFEVLSAGDKELVHSSMIKLLLDSEITRNYMRQLFGLEDTPIGEVYTEFILENRKNRFDLYFSLGENRDCVIENKFKSIPSASQITRYISNNRKVILLVLSEDFLCGYEDEVLKRLGYNENSFFSVSSYFTFSDNSKKSVLEVLKQIVDVEITSNGKLEDAAFSFLVQQYYDYLNGIYLKLEPYVKNDSLNFRLLSSKSEVYILRCILLHLQVQIFNEYVLQTNDDILEWEPRNDGGSNTIPCVSFFNTKQSSPGLFIEFQGLTLKSGFVFDTKDVEEVKQLKRGLIEKLSSQKSRFKILFSDNYPVVEYLSIRKIKPGKTTSSTMAFKFDLKFEDLSKQLLINDVVTLLEVLR